MFAMISPEEKKEIIIKTLQETKDDATIEELYDFLYPDESITSVVMEDMPEDLQIKIENAVKEYRSGNYITHEQVKEKMAKWLKA
jgi:hypothetical protein